MKFLNFLSALLLALLLVDFKSCSATSPQACGYTALDGHMEFLRNFPGSLEGQVYVDYAGRTNGVCVQRAFCPASYITQIEKCADIEVNCANLNTAHSEFPACCGKC